MNKIVGEVAQLHNTNIVLTLEGKEFSFAPHDFQTAMGILQMYALKSPSTSGSIRLESYKECFEVSSCESIRAEMVARNTAMMNSRF